MAAVFGRCVTGSRCVAGRGLCPRSVLRRHGMALLQGPARAERDNLLAGFEPDAGGADVRPDSRQVQRHLLRERGRATGEHFGLSTLTRALAACQRLFSLRCVFTRMVHETIAAVCSQADSFFPAANSWEPIPLTDSMQCANFCDSNCGFSGPASWDKRWSTMHFYFHDHSSSDLTCSRSPEIRHCFTGVSCCPN